MAFRLITVGQEEVYVWSRLSWLGWGPFTFQDVVLLFNMLMAVLGLAQLRREGGKVSGVVAAVGCSDDFYF